MLLKKNLKRWEHAGVITADTKQDILSFEKNRKSGRFLRILYAIGAFTIILGLLALIAANWRNIPDAVKLIAHMALNGLFAYGIIFFKDKGTGTAKEMCLLVLTGLMLTIVGLIGQVFHLDGSYGGALTLWMILATPPVIMFGQSFISIVPWAAGLVITAFTLLFEITDLREETIITILIVAPIVIPVGFMVGVHIAKFFKNEAFEEVLSYCAAALPFMFTLPVILVGGHEAGEIWRYISTHISPSQFYLYCAMGLALCWFTKTHLSLKMFYTASLIAVITTFILETHYDGIPAALIFCAYSGVLIYLGNRDDRHWLMNFGITLIALRIYAVYIQVFEDLAYTGFGLIMSGALLIATGYGTHRLIKFVSAWHENENKEIENV